MNERDGSNLIIHTDAISRHRRHNDVIMTRLGTRNLYISTLHPKYDLCTNFELYILKIVQADDNISLFSL